MAIQDRFKDAYMDPLRAGTPDCAYSRAVDIAPHDVDQLTFVTRAIHVGAGGDLTVYMFDGFGNEVGPVTFANIPPGTEKRIRVSRVMSTNTSATQLVALD